MKRILVPYDFSELSEYALSLAQEISASTGAEIICLNVVQVGLSAIFDSEGNLSDANDFDVDHYNDMKKQHMEKLKNLVAPYPNTRALVKIGDAEASILETEQAESVELIIMGTHGSTGFEQWISGSVSDKIIRQAKASVLTLKCQREANEFKKIALASDFAKPAKNNIDELKTLMDVFGAELHLLKINAPWQNDSKEEVEARMQQYCKLNGIEKAVYHIVDSEDVESGIIKFMEDEQIEFIAIGSKGRMGISAFFNGCVSADLVNHIFAPVFTFRA